jgi:hypothetical protein
LYLCSLDKPYVHHPYQNNKKRTLHRRPFLLGDIGEANKLFLLGGCRLCLGFGLVLLLFVAIADDDVHAIPLLCFVCLPCVFAVCVCLYGLAYLVLRTRQQKGSKLPSWWLIGA